MPPTCATKRRKRESIRQFTPSWFAAVMSTGIVATLLATFPYAAPAKLEIGWAFWWLAVVLFCVFSLMLAGRLVFFPETIMPLLLHPVQSMFIGAIPMGLSVIVNGFGYFLMHWWPQEPVSRAAVALWTINAVLATLCTLIIPTFMFTRHSHSFDNVTAVWLMPIVPGVVAANTGALVAQHSGAAEAYRILMTCGFLWGMSVPVALMIITIYLARLAVHKLPPKELIVSSFLPVGPLGMSALSLLNITTAGVRPLEGGSPGELLGGPYAPAFQVVATYAALILWGGACWWLILAVVSVGSTLKDLPFSTGWWGFVFPLGVLSHATVALSSPAKLNSEAFKVVGAAFSACTLALWCIVTGCTLGFGWHGTLFVAPCLSEGLQRSSWREEAVGAPDAGMEPADVEGAEPERGKGRAGNGTGKDSSSSAGGSLGVLTG